MSKWLSGIKSMFKRARIPDKEFQFQLDTMRLHLLLSYWNLPANIKSGGSVNLIQQSEALPHPVREEKLRALLNEQMKQLTIRMAIETGIPLPEGAVDMARNTPERRARPAPGKSSIAGAGMGLYVDGAAMEPGSIAAIHPGLVFLPRHVSKMPGFPSISDPLHHICVRRDGTLIDPNTYQDSDGNVTKLDHLGEGGVAGHGSGNPMAIAHLINHPPEGVEPNVMVYDYDFPPSVSEALSPLVPNEVYKDPNHLAHGEGAGSKLARPSSVLIASRRIEEGEELLLDYRFNPAKKEQWPRWYKPNDEEAAARRWDGSESFG